MLRITIIRYSLVMILTKYFSSFNLINGSSILLRPAESSRLYPLYVCHKLRRSQILSFEIQTDFQRDHALSRQSRGICCRLYVRMIRVV